MEERQEVLEKSAFDENAQFLVETDPEKLRIFRDLMKAGNMVTAYFAGGSEFLLTTVIHVDPERRLVVFEKGPDAERTRQLIAADRMVGVTTHNSVKVQFISEGIRSCRFEGEEALCVNLPHKLLRLQRRETFRQSIPLSMHIPVRLRLEDGEKLDLQLVDISSGGVCLLDESNRVDLPPTTPIASLSATLLEHGEVETSAEVRNRYHVKLNSGKEVQRIGCQFQSLPPRMNAAIQRFIIAIDRERRRLRSD